VAKRGWVYVGCRAGNKPAPAEKAAIAATCNGFITDVLRPRFLPEIRPRFGASMFFTDYSMAPGELARALEERGFDILWSPEHSHIPLSRKTPFIMGGELPRKYHDVMDPFVTLTAAAMATTTLRVGTGVCLVAQRDPIQTAKLVASIDQVSNGRFVFGVGNGWNQDEMENHGTDFATRHKLARERIEAMKAIWTQERAEYHGEFVDFDPIMAWPKPVQRPHPPILVGGAFPYSARRAIRYGDGWMPQVTEYATTPLAELIPRFRQMAAEAGRDPAGLRISIGGQPPDVALIQRYRDLGVDRVSPSLDSAKADVILPVLDHWAGIIREVNG
jgi:probable F420-dependent oxidoreductase